MNLKDKIKFYASALPQVAEVYGKRFIGDVATDEVQQFRKSQCEACVLFTGSNCDKEKFARRESNNGKVTEEFFTLEQVKDNAFFLQILDKNGILRVVQSPEGKRYYRGCGCPQTGVAAKWKGSFKETSLERLDGTAPCPMGKWNKKNYESWKLSRNINQNNR